MYRTRQAPSPTGYLHFGTARTMLFTQLIARKNLGIWYLRLEDTDRLRLQPDAVGSLLDSMYELGLIPDEGVNNEGKGEVDSFYNVSQTGEYGPYIQSERLSIYHKYAQTLLDKQLVYWSYVTPTHKEELVSLKQITKKPINYFQANLQILNNEPLSQSSALNNQETDSKLYQSLELGLKDPAKPDLKFKILSTESIEINDQLLGKLKFELSLEEDFTVIKSDGYPTYHFAHPIDDTAMKTSLIIRAQEWVSSLPKHIKLSQALGFGVLEYMHIPVILGEKGNKKMSKRDGNVNMAEYIEQGYLPEAIINYLVFLGWNPGTEKELYLDKSDFDIDPKVSINKQRAKRANKLFSNILNDFDITKLQKSPARFSLDKLKWFNKEYIKMLSPYEFAYLSRDLKNSIRDGEHTYRLGDYAYIVDFEESKIFGGYKNIEGKYEGIDGDYYPVGGGRDDGQDSRESLLREFEEESGGLIKAEAKDLIPFTELNITYKNTQEKIGGTFSGKTMQLYILPYTSSLLPPYTNTEGGSRSYYNSWTDLEKVIEANKYITYPLFVEWCNVNGKAIYPITNKQSQTIASYILDLPRVDLLTDELKDSNCINSYNLIDPKLITWKKITYEESLANLNEIMPLVESVLDSVESQKLELSKLIYSSSSLELFNKITDQVQFTIKDWLSTNNKDTGSYLWPLRVALSGSEKSPSPFELLALMSKESAIERIKNVLS